MLNYCIQRKLLLPSVQDIFVIVMATIKVYFQRTFCTALVHFHTPAEQLRYGEYRQEVELKSRRL